MDRINQTGKFLKEASHKSELAVKRIIEPPESVEKVRDIFDSVEPFEATLNIPNTANRTLIDLRFSPKLPAVGCCGDCMCGATESYTSDVLIGSNIYVQQAYVPESTEVYLDGIKVTRGVEYSESGPENKQLTINIPFGTITISYIYTVGNCTDTPCVDEFECIDFSLVGVATVFADRYDRGLTENDPIPLGGCGMYASSVTIQGGTTLLVVPDFPIISGPGEANVTSELLLGGVAKTNGATIEAVGVTSDNSWGISMLNRTDSDISFGFNRINATTYQLSLVTPTIYWRYPFTPLEPTGVHTDFTKTENFTVPASFDSAGTWGFRLIKNSTGELSISVWPWGQDEASAGIRLQSGLIDYPEPVVSNLISYELISPNVYALSVGMTLHYIKVGAAGDAGDWSKDVWAQNTGRQLEICQGVSCQVIDGNCWNYFGGCSVNTTYTITTTNTAVPEWQVLIGWPIIVGPPASSLTGLGRALEIRQELGTISGVIGKPRNYIIRGKFRVPFAATVPVNVVFAEYGGTDTPSYGNNNFNGNQLGAFSIMTNSDLIDFEFSLNANADGSARWGVYIPSIDDWARNIGPISGGFLGTGNQFITIQVEYYEVFADSSIDCHGQDVCGICDDVRCPEIVDSFEDDSYSWFSTPSSAEKSRTTADGYSMYIVQGDGSQFDTIGGGVGRVTWHGLTVDGFSDFSLVYSNSPFECRDDTTSEVAASFEFKVNTLSPVSEYAEIEWGGWDQGDIGRISIETGSVTSCQIGGVDMPQSISANTWITVEYQTSTTNIQCRVYPTGTTPTAWTTTVSDSPRQFYVAPAYDQIDTPSNFEVDIKNVTIRRI